MGRPPGSPYDLPSTRELEILVAVREPRTGLEIRAITGLPHGTVYTVVGDMEARGWVESRRFIAEKSDGQRGSFKSTVITAAGLKRLERFFEFAAELKQRMQT